MRLVWQKTVAASIVVKVLFESAGALSSGVRGSKDGRSRSRCCVAFMRSFEMIRGFYRECKPLWGRIWFDRASR